MSLTPRPRTKTLSAASPKTMTNGSQLGFTLSYLRRVPILAGMAFGVVRAETKRRKKEAQKREIESRRVGVSSSVPSRPSASATAKEEPPSRKVKRLFQKTIRDLYKEGSIIIWNGPKRPCSHALLEEDGDRFTFSNCAGSLWKPSNSTQSTTTSTQSSSSVPDNFDDEDLTDPSDNEEAYLPVTPTSIARIVLQTIETITAPKTNTMFGRSRAKPPPTPDEILEYLRASDSQWANLGAWTILDALNVLLEEGRVFKAGGERWALCA